MVTYRFVQEVNQLHVPEQFVSGHGQAMELTHLHEELTHSLPVKCKKKFSMIYIVNIFYFQNFSGGRYLIRIYLLLQYHFCEHIIIWYQSSFSQIH